MSDFLTSQWLGSCSMPYVRDCFVKAIVIFDLVNSRHPNDLLPDELLKISTEQTRVKLNLESFRGSIYSFLEVPSTKEENRVLKITLNALFVEAKNFQDYTIEDVNKLSEIRDIDTMLRYLASRKVV